jgi:tRNA threonylcarbamoyladenosine biosynthesis protein TsaB
VRVLGIETSSVRGSVVLLDGDQVLVASSHERENAHDASLRPLIEQALAEAGWSRTQLERVAVGTGPGSFTGLRVGIAYAQGIAEGLGVPLVGVGSLAAMARGVPGARAAIRFAMLDARRGEFFVAAYAVDGAELLPPQIAANLAAAVALAEPLGAVVLVGRAAQPLAPQFEWHSSADTDLPHARWTALIGAAMSPGVAASPLYLRPAVAVLPSLPPNPLSAETLLES